MPQSELARRSCSRCHGKKIKCNRQLPQCGPCRRTGERCAYEKPIRTPLTRKHLTEVEHQLAESRALVQQYASGSIHGGPHPRMTATIRRGGSSAPSVAAFPSLPGDRAAPHVGNSASVAESSSSNTFTATSNFEGTNHAAPVREENLVNTATGKASSSKAITFPLEPTPASISGNLEWDERNGARNQTPADGMGNLADCGNEGYLGVASGASFLHLTEESSPDKNMLSEPRGLPNAIDSALLSADSQQALPPSRLDSFVDDYFSIYHPSYPIIHEATFRAEYMEVISRPAGTLWHVLLYVISALGACVSGKYPPGTDVALFEAAKSRLSFDILETGSMMLVQVLTLVANYVQKANKPNSGYNYLGLAKRVAVGIGLHREYSDWAVSPWQMEMRRRVWWGLIIFDTGASVTFSRPIDFPTGVDIGLPRNFRDTDLTRASARFPEEAAETTIYTGLRSQALFNLAIRDIFAALISGTYPAPETLLDLDDARIGGWLAALPPYFGPDAPQHPKFALCHAILHLRCLNFKIIMYRPFLIRAAVLQNRSRPTTATYPAATAAAAAADEDPSSPSPIDLAIHRCLAAAAATITATTALWFGADSGGGSSGEGGGGSGGNRSPMACWYGIYFLFQAAIIPIVSLRNGPRSARAAAWRAQVRSAARALGDMAGVNGTAGRCLRVVERLGGRYVWEDGEVGEGEAGGGGGEWGDGGGAVMEATEESPATQLNELNALLWPVDAAVFGGEGVGGDGGITDFFNQLPGFQWE